MCNSSDAKESELNLETNFLSVGQFFNYLNYGSVLRWLSKLNGCDIKNIFNVFI